MQFGESRLSDAECLALVLRLGRKGESAEQMALRVLRCQGGIQGLAKTELRELARLPGVGLVRAAAVGAAFGLARRLTECRYAPGQALHGSGDVARVVCENIRLSRRESFFALLLDARHRIMKLEEISIGSLNSAPVHPREVFAPALRQSAAALIVAHNHPSGDATPSEEDRLITERLSEAGNVLGIDLVDHVVVGAVRYYSFADGKHHPIPR